MDRLLTCILFFFFFTTLSFAQPKHEIRAVWLTTAYGLDWPHIFATQPQNIQRQKEELCQILNELQAAHFNTVLLQTRIRGDVIYPSSIEPWNYILTGKEGKSPGYDPLTFAIEECHKRGMELHAWIVALPLGNTKHVQSAGRASITRRRPSLCKLYQKEWYLDPGNPATQDYLYSLVKEIVTRYDIDGIHLDYIRYPDQPQGFPDQDTYRKYGNKVPLNQWRRNNITSIVRKLYQGIKEIKPWVKVSSSPLGKFRDTSRYSSLGWNGYYTVFQDTQGWMNEGIQDMIFPMMYFKGNGFFPFVLDWQEKSCGRYVVPGLGIYFLHPKEGNWPLEEIERQINFTRQQTLAGQAYYRARFVTDNTKHLTDELVCHFYSYPALVPPLYWLDNVPPTPPADLSAQEGNGGILLTWKPATDNDTCIPPFYIIYGSDTEPVDISCPKNILATRIEANEFLYSPAQLWETKRNFAVTAVDRYGNESEATHFCNSISYRLFQNNGITLNLPLEKDAQYVTITDLTGRCLFSRPFKQCIQIAHLSKGCYRILVSYRSGDIKRKGEFIKSN